MLSSEKSYFDNVLMKYAIIGSRNCGAVDITNMVAAAAASFGTPTAIVSGGARGVDTLAETYAADNGIKFIKITPDYAQYGRAATFIRNRAIIDKADCVVAVWDGQSHGTKYSMDYARKKGKPIKIFMV